MAGYDRGNSFVRGRTNPTLRERFFGKPKSGERALPRESATFAYSHLPLSNEDRLRTSGLRTAFNGDVSQLGGLAERRTQASLTRALGWTGASAITGVGAWAVAKATGVGAYLYSYVGGHAMNVLSHMWGYGATAVQGADLVVSGGVITAIIFGATAVITGVAAIREWRRWRKEKKNTGLIENYDGM